MKRKTYIGQWLGDWYEIFTHELRLIFKDSGVMIIFFLAGIAYPILYNLIYHNGSVEDMPIAVVDESSSADSRRYIQKLDSTPEVEVAFTCINMDEAKALMQQRKVKGIVYFPEDYSDNLTALRQATLSTYADMSSFLYYKNLTMAANHVMLDEVESIQAERYAAAGFSGQMASQLIKAIPYEENIPFNRNFSYTIFFICAALMIVIQQTMFYGTSMLAGTMREQNHSFAMMPDRLKGVGISRVVLGRGAAYWLIYMGIGVYVSVLVPKMFGLPQLGRYTDIIILLLFYVTACVMFCFTFSTLIRRRETVFVLFLFMSPICLFLTGFSWPATSFPEVWKWFSYLFPSTFAARAFINLNTAGATLPMVAGEMAALAIQTIVYYILACAAVFGENIYLKKRSSKMEKGLAG